MSYAFMTTEKVKTISALKSKMNHNYRKVEVVNADPNREHWNEEIIPMKDADYIAAYERKIAESNYYKSTKVRKDAVRAIEVLTTFNSSDVEKDFDLEEWKRQNVKWLQETFGKDNVVSAVCHLDENSPHIHAIVIPMVNDRLNAKHFLGSRKQLIELQNSYAKSMEPLGLKRGLKNSRARHEDIRRFYGAVNAEIAKELPEVKMHEGIPETAEEYRKRINEYYKDINLKHLAELKRKERQIAEARTHDLNETLEQKEVVRKLDEANKKLEQYEELEREFGALPQIKGKLITLHQLNEGRAEYAKENPAEQEMILQLTMNMQKVIEWKRKKDAKKRKQSLEKDLQKET